MSDSFNNKSGGIGFVGLLTILFIGLKLTDYIDWSWWWVLSPIWISVSIVGLIILVAVVILMATPIIKMKGDQKENGL